MSPPTKRARLNDCLIRARLFEEEIINLVKSSWQDSTENVKTLSEADINIINDPFPVCIVNNFITDTTLLKSTIVDVLQSVKFNDKSNDLYQFRQSDDVGNLKISDNIQTLYETMRTQGRLWVSKIFGDVNLRENISATFSAYGHHDRLLCHDDKCEDRHIAFILYLVEDWKDEDGGSLQLFSSNSEGYPDKIIRSLCPKFNTLVLFEVTHTSFHQVSEVMNSDKIRLSLNGWFHMNEKKSIPTECKTLDLIRNYGTNEIHEFENYFSKNYFYNENVSNIKKLFTANSEIQLDKFFISKFWEQIQRDISDTQIKWTTKGPPNIRKYEIADPSTLPQSLRTLKNILESKQWFEFVQHITSLDFVPSINSDLAIWECGQLPACTCEIQKWSQSNYTLVHDQNPEFHLEALDIILRMPFNECQYDNTDDDHVPEAGDIIYIDGESKDEECLLRVGYKFNSLALVYRDSKTLRFTKYLHSDAKPFYQVFCTLYPWRPPPDRPDLKHCDVEESTTDYSSDESAEVAESED